MSSMYSITSTDRSPHEKGKTKLSSRLTVCVDWRISFDHTLMLTTVNKDKTTHTDNRPWSNCKNGSLQLEGQNNATLFSVRQCNRVCFRSQPRMCTFVGRTNLRHSMSYVAGLTCFWDRHKFNLWSSSAQETAVHLAQWPHTRIKCHYNRVERKSKLETIRRASWQIADQQLLGTNNL